VDFGCANVSDTIFLGQSLLLSTTVLNYTSYMNAAYNLRGDITYTNAFTLTRAAKTKRTRDNKSTMIKIVLPWGDLKLR